MVPLLMWVLRVCAVCHCTVTMCEGQLLHYVLQIAPEYVAVSIVMAHLQSQGLHAHQEAVALRFLDLGHETKAPMKDIVQILRDTGVPPSRALVVKAALTGDYAVPV